MKVVAYIKENPNQFSIKQVAQHFNKSTASIYTIKDTHDLGDLLVRGKCGRAGNAIIDSSEDLSKGEEKMRDATKQEQSRVEALLKSEGYKPNTWSLAWVHLKDELERKHTVLLKNPQQVKQEEDDKQEYLGLVRKSAPKYPKIKRVKEKDPHMLMIDIADLHIGKYAVNRNGETCYDTDTAVQMARNSVTEILKRTQCFPVEKILFPIGNDILHIDNKNGTTTKGTSQDTSGLWNEMYRSAKVLYTDLLEQLATIAPVEVVYNSSNHDEHLGFCLAETLEARFHNSKDINFDISTVDRRYFQYGKNMIGLDHGDGAKMTEIPLLMASEEPHMWADTHFRFFYRHHLHHKIKHNFLTGKDFPGVEVQYLRSLSFADYWHMKNGYSSAPQAVDAFIFHPEHGQMGHFPCVFNK